MFVLTELDVSLCAADFFFDGGDLVTQRDLSLALADGHQTRCGDAAQEN